MLFITLEIAPGVLDLVVIDSNIRQRKNTACQ
jgi:hypothetical protein